MFPCSTSSSIQTLKPMITASSGLISSFARAEIMSVFFMWPILAFTTWIFSCFNKVKRASRLPRESAFTIIPLLSVWRA